LIGKNLEILTEGSGILEVWPMRWMLPDKYFLKMNAPNKGDMGCFQGKTPSYVMDEVYKLAENQKVLYTITK